MDFSEALLAIKKGEKIARSGWNGSNMFAVLSQGAKDLPSNKFFNTDLAHYAEKIGGAMDVRPSFMLKTAHLVAQLERERIAKKIEQLPFGDTSASFAIYVREA